MAALRCADASAISTPAAAMFAMSTARSQPLRFWRRAAKRSSSAHAAVTPEIPRTATAGTSKALANGLARAARHPAASAQYTASTRRTSRPGCRFATSGRYTVCERLKDRRRLANAPTAEYAVHCSRGSSGPRDGWVLFVNQPQEGRRHIVQRRRRGDLMSRHSAKQRLNGLDVVRNPT